MNAPQSTIMGRETLLEAARVLDRRRLGSADYFQGTNVAIMISPESDQGGNSVLITCLALGGHKVSWDRLAVWAVDSQGSRHALGAHLNNRGQQYLRLPAPVLESSYSLRAGNRDRLLARELSPVPMPHRIAASGLDSQRGLDPGEPSVHPSLDGSITATIRPLPGGEVEAAFETQIAEHNHRDVEFAFVPADAEGRSPTQGNATFNRTAGDREVWEAIWVGALDVGKPHDLIFGLATYDSP